MDQLKIFTELSQIDCKDHIEKKGGLDYLNWVWQVGRLQLFCEEKGLSLEYDYDGIGNDGLVYTHVAINGESRRMWLPVMDYRNRAIDMPTTTDINRTIARCLAKCVAVRWGLGYRVYMGEGFPADEPAEASKEFKPVTKDNWEQLNKAYTKEQIKQMYKDLGITRGADMSNDYAIKKIDEYLANIKNELPAKPFY